MRAVFVVVMPEIPDGGDDDAMAMQMQAVGSALKSVVPAPERLIITIREVADAVLAAVEPS